MELKFDNSSPIFVQIVEQMLALIASGKLAPGQKIEPVRILAAQYKVNPNTMQKSLERLGDMGYLFTERTSGRFVTKDPEKINELRQKVPQDITTRYIKEMLDHGIKPDEITDYVQKNLKDRSND